MKLTGLIGQIVVLSRGVLVPLLDGSLVPFSSKILVACMRANYVEKMETLVSKRFVLTA